MNLILHPHQLSKLPFKLSLLQLYLFMKRTYHVLKSCLLLFMALWQMLLFLPSLLVQSQSLLSHFLHLCAVLVFLCQLTFVQFEEAADIIFIIVFLGIDLLIEGTDLFVFGICLLAEDVDLFLFCIDFLVEDGDLFLLGLNFVLIFFQPFLSPFYLFQVYFILLLLLSLHHVYFLLQLDDFWILNHFGVYQIIDHHLRGLNGFLQFLYQMVFLFTPPLLFLLQLHRFAFVLSTFIFHIFIFLHQKLGILHVLAYILY